MLRRPSGPPAVVWLLCVLGFLMPICSSLLIPTYFGFDEPQHVDMVVAVLHGDGWPGPGDRKLAVGIRHTSDLYYNPGSSTRPLDVGLTTVPARGHRPSLEQAGGFAQSTTGYPNQIVQHPPLYYALVAGGVEVLDARDWSYDRLVELMRILTALLVAPVPILAWAICRRLGASDLVGTSAAALTVGVPGLTRIAGMVNNDGFLVLTSTALLLGVVRVATGDLSRRTAIVVGGLTAAVLLSKGFGLPLPLLVLLAYLFAARRALRSAVVPLALALGIGFVAGGFWWVRNVLLYGAIQPAGYGAAAMTQIYGHPKATGLHYALTSYVQGVADRLSRSFWGGVGTTAPPTLGKPLATILCVLLAAAVVAGIAWGVRDRGWRPVLLLLVLPVLLALAIVVQGSLPLYHRIGQIRGVQGRYLYLDIAGLAVCAAIAGDRLLGRLRPLLPALLIAAVAVMQLVSGYRVLRALWWQPGGGNSLSSGLRHLEVLSPYPDAVTQLLFALTALTAVAALVLAALQGVRGLTRSGREPASQPA